MCVFCDIANHQIKPNIIFENENVMAFLDINPINEGHTLIIPKKHYLDTDELPDVLLHELMNISKKLITVIKQVYKPDGYSVMQNGGKFNDIGHYHIHIFPRYQNDGFGWTESGNRYEVNETIAKKLKKELKKKLDEYERKY